MKLLRNVRVEQTSRNFRHVDYLPQASLADEPVYRYREVPTVQIQMPADDWQKIIEILKIYEHDIGHPALRDLANQFHEMKCLLGE